MTKAIYLTLTFVALSLSGIARADSTGSVSAGRPCFGMGQIACEVFYRTNLERRKYNLPALTFNSHCLAMAQEQSSDMDHRNYFNHTRPAIGSRPGESFSHRASRFGLAWVGENIAETQNGAAQAVVMWMNSPGHRANILNKNYTAFAVGYENGMYTQVFTREMNNQNQNGNRAPAYLADQSDELPAGE